ncbi:hypothetical protein GGI00_006057, partial [Coemansia sp. RSA 2681]
MPMRSRIPVRKPVAGVTDENKVGTVAARTAKDGEHALPATKLPHAAAPSALAVPSAAAVAAAPKVFGGAAASRVAMPAKVFGAQIARPAAGVRPRSAFGDAANAK